MQTVCMFNVCLCFVIVCSLLLNNKKFTKTSFANFEAFRISLSAVASFVILNSPRDVVHRETNELNLSFLKIPFLVSNTNLEEKQDMIRWATFIWNQSPLSFTCFFSNSHVHARPSTSYEGLSKSCNCYAWAPYISTRYFPTANKYFNFKTRTFDKEVTKF